MQQNGSYYSADNGFACAAAGQGVKEALQEHLNVIVRNEELETDAVLYEIQEEMGALADDKERLEQEKLNRQERLDDLIKDLAEKEVHLSALQTEIKPPLNIDFDKERIKVLQAQIDENMLDLAENASELEPLLEERTKIKTDLEAPTQVELKPLPAEEQPTTQYTRLEKALACFTAVALVGLIFYLFIFYASVGDRTFTVGVGTNAEKRQIIIPRALFEAWYVEIKTNDDTETTEETEKKEHKNWFVLTFPFIFLTLAFLAYYCHEHKTWWILGGILTATFAIDTIIAVKISMQMHEFTEGENAPYLLSENLTEVLSVLLLGFGVSLLLSYGLYWFVKIWKGAKPNQSAEALLAKLIRAERNERLIELSALEVRIQSIEGKNRKLNGENQAHKDQIELAFKKPIEAEIAALQTDRTHLQNQIRDLGDQIESFQREVNRCETELEELVTRRRRKFVDIKKLEAQAHEFITGWCRYISQRKTAETSHTIADQISEVQQLAQNTLKSYIASIQNT